MPEALLTVGSASIFVGQWFNLLRSAFRWPLSVAGTGACALALHLDTGLGGAAAFAALVVAALVTGKWTYEADADQMDRIHARRPFLYPRHTHHWLGYSPRYLFRYRWRMFRDEYPRLALVEKSVPLPKVLMDPDLDLEAVRSWGRLQEEELDRRGGGDLDL